MTLRAFSLSVFSPSSAYQNGLTLSQHMRPNKPQSKTLLFICIVLHLCFSPYFLYQNARTLSSHMWPNKLHPKTCLAFVLCRSLQSPLLLSPHNTIHWRAMKFIAANKLSEPSTRDHCLSLKGDIERQPGSDGGLNDCTTKHS